MRSGEFPDPERAVVELLLMDDCDAAGMCAARCCRACSLTDVRYGDDLGIDVARLCMVLHDPQVSEEHRRAQRADTRIESRF